MWHARTAGHYANAAPQIHVATTSAAEHEIRSHTLTIEAIDQLNQTALIVRVRYALKVALQMINSYVGTRRVVQLRSDSPGFFPDGIDRRSAPANLASYAYLRSEDLGTIGARR